MDPASSADDQPSREQRLDELLADYLQAGDGGKPISPDEFVAAHPEFAAELGEFFADQDRFARAAAGCRPAEPSPANDATLDSHAADAPGSAARPTTERPKVRYFGDYELLDEIARGGMGVVYKTRQVNLKRIVALKMILVGQLANEDEVKRFYAEAQAAAKLEHPQIVPIYEIGQHEGQHYFTMAFIDGESLAHRISREVLAPREATAIVHKVARAIAFAHVEGVVHRDLKPANILLDRAGEPHVTDFGLAKRVGAAAAGDASAAQLTATGQVLGTPSYMPPEQAAGRTDDVGPLADVYSLGAVLYCLLTGRPPFQAASPLDTLLQVIDQEPLSPRALNPAVPRDLETICLKCLEKTPERRFESATALADELERYLHGEPIRARPISLTEALWRRAKKHHRLLKSAAMATAATILLAALAVAGWDYYRKSRLGLLSLTTEGYPLTAEVLGPHDDGQGDDSVLQSFTVPTDQPVRLWSGDYRLRVSGPGLPSETLLASLDAGGQSEYSIDLSARRLWKPMSLDSMEHVDVVQFGQRTDVLLLENRFGRPALRRLAGSDLRPLWTLPLDEPQPFSLQDETAQALSQELVRYWWTNLAPRPMLLEQAVELTGDAEPELIVCWPLRDETACAALSGATGQMVWLHKSEGPDRLAAAPLLADANGDGVADLVRLAYRAGNGSLWMEAVSGVDGTTLWRHDLEGVSPLNITNARFSTQRLDDGYQFPCWLELIGDGPARTVVTSTVQHVAGVRLADGKPAWPAIDAGRPWASRPQWADVDGNGSPELLAAVSPDDRAAYEVDFAVRVPGASAPSWTARLPIPSNNSVRTEGLARRPWAHVVDLDANGKPEVIVPLESPGTAALGFRLAVRAFDGASGGELWTHVLDPRQDAEWQQVLDMPDVDGDGRREVIVVSVGPAGAGAGTGPPEFCLLVDVLSGATGRSLALWRGPLTRNRSGGFVAEQSFESARWWQADAAGVPQLLISTVGRSTPSPRRVLHFVAPLEAKELQRVEEVRLWHAADFNADGLLDLGIVRDTLDGQQFQVFAGGAPAAWRRLARLQPAQDYDGDGLREAVELLPEEARQVRIVSGRDGQSHAEHAIGWQSSHIAPPAQCDTPPSPHGDFDGDGVADLLIHATSRVLPVRNPSAPLPFPLQALSGKTGQRLWGERPWTIPEEIVARRPDGLYLMFLQPQADDLDRDGSPEIVCAYRVYWGEQAWSGGFVGQVFLAAISSRNGAFQWNRPIGRIRKLPSGMSAEDLPWLPADGRADLDGDGVADIVATIPTTKTEDYPPQRYGFETLAISGRTGHDLWPAVPADESMGSLQAYLLSKTPQALSVCLAGSEEPAVLAAETLFDANQAYDAPRRCRVRALNGDDGKVRWEYSWQSTGNNSEYSAPQLSMAAVDFAGDGNRTVCIYDYDDTPDAGGATLHLVDSSGALHKRIVGEKSWNYDSAASRLWPVDLDGDRRQELVYLCGSTLQAIRGDGAVLWHREGMGVLTDIAWHEPFPQLVVAQSHDFLGLDGRNGNLLWRGASAFPPGPRPGRTWCLLPGKSGDDARILAVGDEAALHVALPTDAAGRYRLGTHRSPGLSAAALPADPRWLRPLPWIYSNRAAWLEFSSVAFSLVLIVLPGAYLGFMLRQRTWSLRSWLSLPLVIGLVFVLYRLVASLPSVRQMGWGLAETYPHALGGTLALIFPALSLWWAIRRRWWRVAVLLGTSLVLALLLGLIMYLIVARDLVPQERFDWNWRGCWNLWFPAALVSGWLALFGTGVAAAVSRLRARTAPHHQEVAPRKFVSIRIALASVALMVGTAAALSAVFVAMRLQPIPVLLFLGWGGAAAILLIAGLLALRSAKAVPGRWLIVAPALAAGLAGGILAALTSDSGVGAVSTDLYELWVKVFGRHIGLWKGQLQPLETQMMFCATAIGVAYVAAASIFGALVGAAVRRVTIRRASTD